MTTTERTPALGAAGVAPVAWRWRWTARSYGIKGAKPGQWYYTDDRTTFSDAGFKEIEPLYAHPPQAVFSLSGCEAERAEALQPELACEPPQADVEAVREKVASMAWRYRGNDRHGGPWYEGAKPTDSPAMQDAFGFTDAILAAIGEGSGSLAPLVPGAATARTAGLSEGGE